MSRDPSAAIQRAEAAALLVPGGLADIVGDRVRDEQDAASVGLAKPYILLGDHQVIDDSTQCSDTTVVVSTIHIIAAGKKGRLIAKQITDLAMAALDSLVVAGFSVSDDPEMSAQHRIDPDGVTAHSLLTVTYEVNPA